jgi:GT2 family glycosyltransferase
MSGKVTRMPAPRISILTAVYNPPHEAFEDTIKAVLGQSFTNFEWVLADDCSPDPWVRGRLRRLAESDPRVKIVERETNGGIAAASQSALEAASGEFVALMDHDDILDTRALRLVINRVTRLGNEVDFLYSDQAKVTEDGRKLPPYYKPDWSPERLRHHMYTSHFAVMRRELVSEVGGFRPGFDGSQDHDLALRVSERARHVEHIGEVLYYWRQVEGSAAVTQEAKPYAWDAGVRAVQDQLDRLGIRGKASRGKIRGTYWVEREPDLTTPVSIIIPTIGTRATVFGRPRVLVTETIRSVVERSAHQSLQFVVVYDTPTPAPVLAELRRMRDLEGIDIVLVEFTEKFNFSAKCNVGALASSGEVLVFLNDDMEARSEGLIEDLIAPLSEPGVGATGPKLFFENGRIQHAGLQYGSDGIHHNYYKASPEQIGSHGDLWVNREVSALTGACIAVRREVFEQVGGFAEALASNFNDVDFCLKVRALGLRLLWLHAVELYHFESFSRETKVHAWEVEFMARRWGHYKVVRERYTNEVR